MQRYINQLSLDLRSAAEMAPSKTKESIEFLNEKESFSQHIESVEQFLHGEQKPLSSIFGIGKEVLPHPDRLSMEQMQTLVAEMDNLWSAYHFIADFPEGVPASTRYQFMRDSWENKHVHLEFGDNHIEFCDYNWAECPFPEYCQICKEVENNKEETSTNPKLEIPNHNLLPSEEELCKFEREERKRIIKDTIISTSEDGLISGIYDYCDRWCEKCTKTDECLLFKQEKNFFPENENIDINKQEFWDIISDIHEVTLSLLDKSNPKLGLDRREEPDIKLSTKPELTKEQSELNDLAQLYTHQVIQWFKKNDHTIRENIESWEVRDIDYHALDHFQTIQWYHTFIAIKTDQALFNLDESDINGSAKLAIIGIDKSIMAWIKLLNIFEDFEDEILETLRLLTEIKEKIVVLFPDAEAFKRPGFED
ncbi:MAG: hypothetical protein JEZ03_03915 [Bacteroidales bacterium]|nr:hypothetical protein [Bacteroidales bacterium]